MSPNERFSLFAHIHSLQFVTNLRNSSKGWAKGHVLVSGPWSSSSKGPDRISLEIPSKERWGRLVEWMEKASFTHLNKLFEIDVAERAHNVLLSNKNLQDLLFYEVACLADSEARQTRLKE
ncbi:hypothetical protein AAG906_040584 [Vitis piasezkii]